MCRIFINSALPLLLTQSLVLCSVLASPCCWSAVVGIETFGGIPLSSSSMLVPRETGDLGAGAAAGARLWNVTGGPGNRKG